MDKKHNRHYAILKTRELADELRKNNIRVWKMFLFGSYASDRKVDLEWSDIDIAIVSDDFSGSRFDDNILLLPITVKVDTRIETHPFTKEDFENSPFAQDEILNKGILITA